MLTLISVAANKIIITTVIIINDKIIIILVINAEVVIARSINDG